MHTGRQHEKQSGEGAGENRRREGCVQHNNKYEKLCRIKLESSLQKYPVQSDDLCSPIKLKHIKASTESLSNIELIICQKKLQQVKAQLIEIFEIFEFLIH